MTNAKGGRILYGVENDSVIAGQQVSEFAANHLGVLTHLDTVAAIHDFLAAPAR